MTNPQIIQLQEHFDGLNVDMKKVFIQKLQQKLQNSSNKEYNAFLLRCVETYKAEINNALPVAKPQKATFEIQNGVLEKIFIGDETEIIIPYGVTAIGDFAFKEFSSLTNITIPDSVTSIGNYAFSDCSSLTSVTMPDGVTSIGKGAFINCSSLTSITIPDGVTSVGELAFSGCGSLTNITIPDSVTSIGIYTFFGCRLLTSVTIPDSVTHIEHGVFFGCRSLTNIAMPNSVTSIGNEAFAGCSSLTIVTIPDSITSIGKGAFLGCKHIEILKSDGTIYTEIHPLLGFNAKMCNASYDDMSGHEFESFCGEILAKNGFSNIQVTKGSGDYGVDITAIKSGLKYAIQCKRHNTNIGYSAVQEIFAGKSFYDCHFGAILTNQYFTESAKNGASKFGILLWDRDELERFQKI